MAMTAQDYKLYKSLDPSELTDEERKELIDFERAEAKAPSLDDVQWATEVHNTVTKNPSTLGRELKESGDYQKALDILDADRAYTATIGTKKQSAYVQPVKRIPDDLNSQFNFNWKSAYENQPNAEKLRDTEADYDRLKKFIDSKIYDVNDPANLQKIAYELHMYNPNTMKWSEFINSEQGNEFKKYIKDVEKYQKDKAVEKIFSGEDPVKASYPLIGDVDIPGSQFLVDFGLPIAKEYAKKNYENINELSDMAGPLATDFATNLVMMSNKPAAGVVAPVLSNAGQVAFNKEDPVRAGVATIVGAAVNKATPYALNRYSNTLRRGETGAEKEAAAEIIKGVDNAAKKASSVQKRLNEGAVYETKYGYVSDKDKIIYTDLTKNQLPDEYSNYTVKNINAVLPFKKGIKDVFSDLKSAKNADGLKDKALQIKGAFDKNGRDIITKEDYAEYVQSKHLLRTWPFTKEWKERRKTREVMKDIMEPEDREKLLTDIHNLKAQGKSYADLTPKHFIALGYDPKESVGQFISRETPDPLRAYITNMLGRDRFASPLFRVPATLGFDPNNYIEEKSKKKKSKISEIFGE
jgi:hypothetical protein